MLDLSQHEADLRRIVAAGPDGLPVEVVGESTVIRLALDELVTITKGEEPQRVVATAKGRTFRHRGAFA